MKLKNWLLLASLFSLSSYAQNVQGDMNGDNQITMYDVTLLVDRYVTGNTNAENGCVDLGLSVMWASSNIGATKPEDVGTLFAWGETTTKSSFEVSNYFDTKDSGRTFKKYNEQGPYTLADEDDAAYVATDGALRMPTQEEWKELYEKCSITSKFISGVRCYKFTGPSGNYIILPYVSDMDGTSPGSVAFAYWSSSLDPSRFRYAMMFNGTTCSSQARVLGASVRGVKNVEKPVLISKITFADENLQLEIGEKTTVDGTISPVSVNRPAISWKSSNTTVAKVSNGVITGVGKGTCTITARANEGGASASCLVYVGMPTPKGEHNGHEYVDLGTGVKWATTNIGADSPEKIGLYFAWGETTGYKPGQHNFYYDDYAWGYWDDEQDEPLVMTKYYEGDQLKTLMPEDDAAQANWGGNWRMPTMDEFNSLLSECYWQFVTTYNGRSVNGYIVYKAKADADKGKNYYDDERWAYILENHSPVGSYSVSDPHIFLPITDQCHMDELWGDVDGGYYWSSSSCDFEKTNYWDSRNLLFDSEYGYGRVDFYDRCNGMAVRPVCK